MFKIHIFPSSHILKQTTVHPTPLHYTTLGKRVIFKEEARRGRESCSTLKWSSSSNWSSNNGNGEYILFAGYYNGRISSYALKNMKQKDDDDCKVYPISKLNIGSSVQCLVIVPTSRDIFVGCADGGLRLVTVGVDARFDHEPVIFHPFHEVSRALDPWLGAGSGSGVGVGVGIGGSDSNESPALTSISAIHVPGSGNVMKYSLAIGWEDGTVSLCQIQRLPTLL